MEQKQLFQLNMQNLMLQKYEKLRAAVSDRDSFMENERSVVETKQNEFIKKLNEIS